MDTGLLIGRIASRLLAVDGVFRGVQRTLLGTLDARRTLERNVERVLAGANLPSARDVERVIAQVRELDRDLGLLAKRVESLKEDLSAHER